MNRKLSCFLKVLFSAMCACILLNIIMSFYYYVPWKIENMDGATDFSLPSHFRGCIATEGFSSIRLDENGYNNSKVPSSVDILCMGSSHTFAYNVNPNQGWPALLEQKSENRFTCYNIGAFGHMLPHCLGNLKAAVEKYRPARYIIMETSNVRLDIRELDAVNDGELSPADAPDSKGMQLLKRVPLLQITMHQLKSSLSGAQKDDSPTSGGDSTDMERYRAALDAALKNASETAASSGCMLVIFYHPAVEIDDTGAPYTKTDAQYLELFESLCTEYGILFLDLTDAFLQGYRSEFLLPNGFSNTAVGYGHLNAHGHEMIADAIYQAIKGE